MNDDSGGTLDYWRDRFPEKLNTDQADHYYTMVDLLHSESVDAQDMLSKQLDKLGAKHPAVKAFAKYKEKWLEAI